MKQVLLRLEPDFSAEIDQARGDVPRTVWIRRACERSLEHHQRIFGGYSVNEEAVVTDPTNKEQLEARYGKAASFVIKRRVDEEPRTPALPIGPASPKPGSRLKKR